jgi:hypothetical protein
VARCVTPLVGQSRVPAGHELVFFEVFPQGITGLHSPSATPRKSRITATAELTLPLSCQPGS